MQYQGMNSYDLDRARGAGVFYGASDKPSWREPWRWAGSRGSQRVRQELWRQLSWKEWVCLVLLGLLPFVCGLAVGLSTSTDIEYREPSWAPPAWLFAPAWTVLYLLMGLGSVLVYVYGGGANAATLPPLLLYAAQLVLNLAWTPVFFTLREPCIAEAMIGAIWFGCLSCLVTFFPISKLGSLCLVPYLAWLSFATALNNAIVSLNGCNLNHTLPA